MKNKFKILGVLIVMAIALCGAFNLSVPKYVFADEVQAEESTTETNDAGTFEGVGSYAAGDNKTLKATLNMGYEFYWLATYDNGTSDVLGSDLEYPFEAGKDTTISVVFKKAGTFTVEGEHSLADGASFFIVGKTATLKAVMEPGFKFAGWIATTVDGTPVTLAGDPTSDTYTLSVTQNIKIKPTWEKEEYTIELAEGLSDYFDIEISNTTQQVAGVNYYDDKMQVTISVAEDDLYVKDLAAKNIKVNGVDLYHINNYNPMSVTLTNLENGSTGFESAVITLDIQENITIDIEYVKMFKLSIASGNDIDIANIIGFINPIETQVGKEYYSKLNDYTYLVYDNVGMNLSLSAGNNIYVLRSYTLHSEVFNSYSVSVKISEPKTLNVKYELKDYTIKFVPYLRHANDRTDLLSEYHYEIEQKVKPGETISFTCDADDCVKITKGDATAEYDAEEIYGYKFKNFEFDGQPISEYTMSSADPENIIIKMIFEYVEYTLNVKFVDQYFKDGVELTVTDDRGLTNGYTNGFTLVKGTNVKITATTEKYQINGWSATGITLPEGEASTILAEGFEFEFQPTDITVYEIKLDVGYKYITSTFSLDSRGCVYDSFAGKYSANLQVSHIENIAVELKNSNTKANVTFSGTTYSIDDLNNPISGDITAFESDVIKVEEGKYELKYQGYTVYLYMAGEYIDEDDKISLPNITSISDSIFYTTDFVYKGTKFVLKNADINTPATVVATGPAEDESNYYIKLENLLPNTLLIYSAVTTDKEDYVFSKFVRSGTEYTLGSFSSVDNSGVEHHHRLAPATMDNNISVRYFKTENKVHVQISNTAAYSYNNIIIKVGDAGVNMGEAEPGDPNQNANVITEISFDAQNGDEISIEVDPEAIEDGYKFNNFSYGFDHITQQANPYKLSFIMDSAKHANKVITLNFSEIEYVIKVNRVSGLGVVTIGNSKDNATVVITGNYNILATPSAGHYISNAYIGTDIAGNKLSSLISPNTNSAESTSFVLNNENGDFKSLIIDNANANNEVTLYITFTSCSYDVKVYLKLGINDGSYEYPAVSINGENLEIKVENPVRYVEMKGIKHGDKVVISINKASFRAGLTINKDYNVAGVSNESVTFSEDSDSYIYTLDSISKDNEYTIQLKYIEYVAKFKSVDISGNEKELGIGSIKGKDPIILGSNVNYEPIAYDGYSLKEVYYFKDGNKNNIDNTYFNFDPKYFDIKNDGKNYYFEIYLKFDYKVIDLTIGNNITPAGIYANKTPSELATFKVEMLNAQQEWEDITNQEIYSVRKDDRLRITVDPISIGVELKNVSLGSKKIYSSLTPSEFKTILKYDGDNFVGVYHVIEILFDVTLITELDQQLVPGQSNIEIKNNLEVRKYTVKYSYNYINYNFGVQLSITVNTDPVSGDINQTISRQVAFGAPAQFSCSYANKGTSKDPFTIKGVEVEGFKLDAEPYMLSDEEIWTALALSKYKLNSDVINVQLELMPRIFLQNYDEDSPQGEYWYTKTYNANYQGLNENKVDVSVGGGFNITIEYSYDGGITFTDQKPKNAGHYPVKITAQIKTGESQTRNIVYNEKVTLFIKPVSLVLTLKEYNQANPIIKQYNGLTSISSPATTIVPYIQLDGVIPADSENVSLDASKIKADFSGAIVNEAAALYNLILENVYLIQTGENYVISTGTTKVFEKVGKINPLTLTIKGVDAYDKVNDGSTDVAVNIDNLVLSGKLEFDSTEIIKENLIFYHEKVAEDYKGPVDVLINFENAISGADSINYTFEYDPIEINIHPYELEFYLNDVGTFKVVDYDKKCLIPLDRKLIVKAYARGSSEYNKILTLTETRILKSENLNTVYELILQGADGVNHAISEELYIYLPAVSKITKVFQKVNNEKCEGVNYIVKDGFIVVKPHKGKSVLGVVVKTTYLPLWVIILIVVGSLVVVGLIVLTFILIRRRSKRKYRRFDKI